MPSEDRGRRVVYLLACALPVWAVVALYTGGVGWRIGPLRLSSRQPWRPLVIGFVVATWYVWRYSRAQRESDGRWLLRHTERIVPFALAIVVLLGVYVGVRYGSFAAAGSDSYGYVSQARLWLSGTLRVAQPWVTEFSWPNREWIFSPLGYRPHGTDGTIVPTYPPGLSMVMALFQAVVGARGPFYVAPVAGALLLWLAYGLGRTVAEHTPENAVVLAVQHSGSVRYYANRVTLRYDWLADDQLDEAVRDLALKGRRAFILVDDWEEKEFKARFTPANRLGRLDWDPIARLPGAPQVLLYELR